MPEELTREQLQRLARLGAHARLEELDAERRAILRAFPGLSAQAARQAAVPAGAKASPAPSAKTRRRKTMSAAQRQAASERMRKFWADKRATAES